MFMRFSSLARLRVSPGFACSCTLRAPSEWTTVRSAVSVCSGGQCWARMSDPRTRSCAPRSRLISAWRETMSVSVQDRSATATELQRAFVGLVRAFGLHQPERTPCGQPISTSEAHALLELDGEPRLTQNELARRLRLEKSTVSRLVVQLEQRQWLRRERDPNDGRVQRLQLTERGREAARALEAARTSKFERLAAAIGAEEHARVVEALQLLAQISGEDGA